MLETDWIVLLSAAALAFSVMNYVLLDGTDLGVGILMGLTRCAKDRRAMAVTILPIWDANETWLVLGGGGLLALFPLAYAILLPALYLPFILMFLALILRAVALEFRDHSPNERIRRGVDGLLLGGSALAGAAQGAVLGTLVQGVPHGAGQYNGNGTEWLNLFPLFCGAVLIVGYMWLGACWLYWRTVDELQRRSRLQAKVLAAVTVVLLIALVAWTAALDSRYAHRLSDWRVWIPAVTLLITLLIVFALGLRSRRHALPLFAALGVFVLAFLLMVVALYPLIVPPQLTLQAAASSRHSQVFMLIGFAVLIPVTLIYNTFGFSVFSGKVRPARK
ncbi:cytochrome d ubiquinol oxidase subunit II [Pseudomonas vancouverensis]|uniref:Cytochrome d ubiquinol oxidase subunit II n=1 Tax=Pseudomonas vancouverensis TaxID=95300 RepID=A0A1H2NXS9_PSEVA|nr:cytochrome d ubiquinol oxidase subunit II [Pseudomonas vancouverensis]KAB0496484.1 cytochrome d ubiquinol oxidase subunit II [Pseudomonas vancouverensis]TDB64808.1 cytochrome d ubiquinol oxidase subunit II [Pseudomonas vancouverensis]SDV09931.1 cytochrome bd-I ubiquinol oxidase subunit 2 apoprotein [Pseudomonas vancouverensis]